ncbi:MAG: phage major capsid protein [Planctomycetota bacterium]
MDPQIKQQLDTLAARIKGYPDLEAAVDQLENQVKGLGLKLAAAHQRAYGPDGHYRGTFRNEQQARGFGTWFMARCAKQDWALERLEKDFPEVHKDFTSSDAGNLLPEEYASTIVDLIQTYGVIERFALRVPMARDTQRYSKKSARGAAAPMDEGQSVSETKPTLVPKALTAKKWGYFIEVPNEVLEDAAVAIGEMVAMDIAEAFALASDQAGFLGDGTSSYNSITGVLNALITQAIVTAGGDAWSDYTIETFAEAVGKLTPKAFQGSGPAWFMSSQFYWTTCVPLILGSGGVTAGEIEGQRRQLLLGFPVEFTQVLPSATAADQVSAVIGNLRAGVAFGDRRQITMKSSSDFGMDRDVLAMLGTRRFDINVHGAGQGSSPEVIAAVKTAA